MRIFYVTDGRHVFGGQLVNLEHVRALRRMGYDASYLVVPLAEGAPTQPRFPPGPDVPWRTRLDDLTADDVVVLGEMHGQAIMALAATPARKVIHNQNPFYTFHSFRDLGVVREWGCEAMLAPSAFTAGWLRRMGWREPLHRITPAVDPVFARTGLSRTRLRIAVMPRKRPGDYSLVRGLVRTLRPDLGHVSWVKIEQRTRPEVAIIMAGCDLFLSLSHNEGLGLPPLEAMATGALVVGYHGQGGLEYATPENGDWFEDSQHFEVAEAVAARLDALIAGDAQDALREAGRRTAAAYSPARFEAELAAAWGALAGPP